MNIFQSITQGSESSLRRLQTSPPLGTQIRDSHSNHLKLHTRRRLHERNHRSHVRIVSIRGAIQGCNQREKRRNRLKNFLVARFLQNQ